MTTAAILQPGYLPWLGFFEQMHRADIFVFLDDVQYTKNDWRNRNRVKTSNGPTWLSVPVVSTGRLGQSLRDTRIADEKWARRHSRTVETAYAAAPHRSEAAGLDAIWDDPPQGLVELDLATIDWCRRSMNLATPTVRSSTLEATPNDPNERLVSICQQIGADTFYEGAAGASYLDVARFERAGIQVEFQAYDHPWYPQQHSRLGFISHLSAIDLILNCGPDSLDVLTGRLVLEAPAGGIRCHADDYRKVEGSLE